MKYTDEQITTLTTFMERWTEADAKVNEGNYYQNYQFNTARLNEIVTDFTQGQKEFIQSILDDARCVIGYINILN